VKDRGNKAKKTHQWLSRNYAEHPIIFFFKILRNRKDTPHVKQAVGSECRCVRTRRKFVLENTDMRDKRAKEQE
jgi:hypothetical protein